MDAKEFYREELRKKTGEIDDSMKQILPIQQKIATLKNEIDALKILIGPDDEKETAYTGTNVLSGMTGMDAYRKLAKLHFGDKQFTEDEIRMQSQKDGLLIKGKLIGRNSSWGIIKKLYEDEFLRRVDKGIYKYNKQFEE